MVTRAKKEGKIKDEFAFQTIIKEINDFRSNCGGLLAYDWIQIPLVYTQVISMFFVKRLGLGLGTWDLGPGTWDLGPRT